MKKIWLIIGLLWLMGGAEVWAGRHTISSLPYTLPTHTADLWDTLYFVDQDTNTSSTLRWDPHPPTTAQIAIRFTTGNNYWRVLFANDTILFGGDSMAQQFRVFDILATNPKAHHIEIMGKNNTTKRGYILSDCAAWTGTETRADLNLPQDTAVWYNPTGIRTAGSQVKIFNMKIEIKGFSHIAGSTWEGMQCIYARDGQGTEIYNCELINRASAFNDRQYYPSPCIRAEAPNYVIAPDTVIHYIHDNIVTSFATHGIVTQQCRGAILIKGNTITIDGRQAMEDGPNEFWGLTHSFGILSNRLARGSRITHNTITAGTSYRGGQGMFFVAEDTVPSHTGWVTVDSNIVNVHNGRTAKYAWEQNMGSAIKLRNVPDHYKIFGNSFIYTCNTTNTAPTGNTQDAYMPQGACFEYQWYEPIDGRSCYVEFYNNLCSLDVVTNVSSLLYRVTALRFTDVGMTAYDPTLKIYNNRIAGRFNWAYEFGTNLGLDLPSNARYILIERDTVVPTTWNDIQSITDGASYGGYSSNNNVIRDNHYVGITPSEGYYYQVSSSGKQLSSFVVSLPNDINNYYQRTLNINVKSELNGRPVSGATVNVYNGSDVLVASGTTDAIGSYNPIVPYAFYSMNSADINYNTFRFNVVKSPTDNVNRLFTVNWNAYKDTVLLPNTLGDGMWPGAADIVEYRTEYSTRSWPAYKLQLRGPKRQILPLNGSQDVVIYTSNSDGASALTQKTLTRYINGVESDHIWLGADADATAYYEASLCVTDNDMIIMCSNNARADAAGGVRIVRVNAATNPMTLVDSRVVTLPYGAIGVPISLGGDSVMIELRRSGTTEATGSYANQMVTITSTDAGATWSSPATFMAWNVQVRSGFDPWRDGMAWWHGIYYLQPTDFRSYYYNGTSWTNNTPTGFSTYRIHREYAACMTEDSVAIVLFADTSNPGAVRYAYKKVNVGSTWTHGTLETFNHAGWGDYPPQLALVRTRSTGGVRAFWTGLATSGNVNTKVLYSAEWTGTGFDTDNRVTISQGTNVQVVVQPNQYPSIHGDRSGVAYNEQYAGGQRWIYASILGDGGGGVVAPDPTGACCLGIANCITATAADCATQGGTYQGDGTVCGPTTCGTPTVTTAAEAITGAVTIQGNVRIE